MNAELAGSVAVVTGGAKGIGRAISVALAQEGADLILVGRDTVALDEAVAAIRGMGRRAFGVAADLTDEAQVARIAELARSEFDSRVDIIVTAAGTRDHLNKPVAELDIEQFNLIMQGNVNGTLLPIRAVLPFMKARKRGKVVAISGVFGLKGHPKHAGGCASKWALEGLVRVLALELGVDNINVNAVCPGYVEGPRSAAGITRSAQVRGVDPAAARAELEHATALKRLSTADDVANAVLFLVSERSRNITGRDLIVDAGWML
jgi:NAD(P)-dependent dehydrogenase (short-subunit alcohol dehydrogenase family)